MPQQAYGMCGWSLGVHPPQHVLDLHAFGTVVGNMLRAHVAAYDALKAQPGGASARIGLVEIHAWCVPRGKGPLHCLAK